MSSFQQERFQGILEIISPKHAFVRSLSLTLSGKPNDPFVPQFIISNLKLRDGVFITGSLIKTRRGSQVTNIESINGISPEKWKNIKMISELDAVSPDEPLKLESKGGEVALRIIDLFAPIGKGQRALIVSPPKAGKTILLQQIARAINRNHPGLDLIVLLVDERPEEVTDIRRSIKGEVFASSNDSDISNHVRLAKLVPEYAKRKVETGRDVVLMIDSLTRIGRAFNSHQRSSGRTMSGGVDIRALEIPKRIFGAARKCEGGGSLTIIATILVETNSRMDELIFQEFKGTGNMEIVLDRGLAEERIFPAFNLNASGTRREELLFKDRMEHLGKLRRSISKLSNRNALLTVKQLLDKYPTNDKLLSIS
ncbi:MAG: transcription termination factor Rho [Candidatus Kryptoniota bacterium]